MDANLNFNISSQSAVEAYQRLDRLSQASRGLQGNNESLSRSYVALGQQMDAVGRQFDAQQRSMEGLARTYTDFSTRIQQLNRDLEQSIQTQQSLQRTYTAGTAEFTRYSQALTENRERVTKLREETLKAAEALDKLRLSSQLTDRMSEPARRAADEIGRVARAYGESEAQLQVFNRAALQLNLTAEESQKAFGRVREVMTSYSADAQNQRKNLEALGVSIADNTGRLKTYGEVLADLANKLRNFADTKDKSQLIFGLTGLAGPDALDRLKQAKDYTVAALDVQREYYAQEVRQYTAQTDALVRAAKERNEKLIQEEDKARRLDRVYGVYSAFRTVAGGVALRGADLFGTGRVSGQQAELAAGDPAGASVLAAQNTSAARAEFNALVKVFDDVNDRLAKMSQHYRDMVPFIEAAADRERKLLELQREFDRRRGGTTADELVSGAGRAVGGTLGLLAGGGIGAVAGSVAGGQIGWDWRAYWDEFKVLGKQAIQEVEAFFGTYRRPQVTEWIAPLPPPIPVSPALEALRARNEDLAGLANAARMGPGALQEAQATRAARLATEAGQDVRWEGAYRSGLLQQALSTSILQGGLQEYGLGQQQTSAESIADAAQRGTRAMQDMQAQMKAVEMTAVPMALAIKGGFDTKPILEWRDRLTQLIKDIQDAQQLTADRIAAEGLRVRGRVQELTAGTAGLQPFQRARAGQRAAIQAQLDVLDPTDQRRANLQTELQQLETGFDFESRAAAGDTLRGLQDRLEIARAASGAAIFGPRSVETARLAVEARQQAGRLGGISPGLYEGLGADLAAEGRRERGGAMSFQLRGQTADVQALTGAMDDQTRTYTGLIAQQKINAQVRANQIEADQAYRLIVQQTNVDIATQIQSLKQANQARGDQLQARRAGLAPGLTAAGSSLATSLAAADLEGSRQLREAELALNEAREKGAQDDVRRAERNLRDLTEELQKKRDLITAEVELANAERDRVESRSAERALEYAEKELELVGQLPEIRERELAILRRRQELIERSPTGTITPEQEATIQVEAKARQISTLAQRVNAEVDRTIARIGDGIADSMVAGSSLGWDYFLQLGKRTLAELLSSYFVQPLIRGLLGGVMSQVGQALGSIGLGSGTGTVSTGGTGQGGLFGGGGMDLLGQARGLFADNSGLNNWFNANVPGFSAPGYSGPAVIGNDFGPFAGAIPADELTVLPGTTVANVQGNAGGFLNTGITGAEALAGVGTAFNIGLPLLQGNFVKSGFAAAGAGIGFLVGGPPGMVLGSTLGGFVSDLFGFGKKKTVGPTWGANYSVDARGRLIPGGAANDPVGVDNGYDLATARQQAASYQSSLNQLARLGGGRFGQVLNIGATQTGGLTYNVGNVPGGSVGVADELALIRGVFGTSGAVTGLSEDFQRGLSRSKATDVEGLIADITFVTKTFDNFITAAKRGILDLSQTARSLAEQSIGPLIDQLENFRAKGEELGENQEEINQATNDYLDTLLGIKEALPTTQIEVTAEKLKILEERMGDLGYSAETVSQAIADAKVRIQEDFVENLDQQIAQLKGGADAAVYAIDAIADSTKALYAGAAAAGVDDKGRIAKLASLQEQQILNQLSPLDRIKTQLGGAGITGSQQDAIIAGLGLQTTAQATGQQIVAAREQNSAALWASSFQDRQLTATQDNTAAIQQLNDTLQDFLKDLDFSQYSPYTAARQFELAKDRFAQEATPETAETLLSTALQNMPRAGEEYFKLYNDVKARLGGAAFSEEAVMARYRQTVNDPNRLYMFGSAYPTGVFGDPYRMRQMDNGLLDANGNPIPESGPYPRPSLPGDAIDFNTALRRGATGMSFDLPMTGGYDNVPIFRGGRANGGETVNVSSRDTMRALLDRVSSLEATLARAIAQLTGAVTEQTDLMVEDGDKTRAAMKVPVPVDPTRFYAPTASKSF